MRYLALAVDFDGISPIPFLANSSGGCASRRSRRSKSGVRWSRAEASIAQCCSKSSVSSGSSVR
jgi:hypothetical protein